MINASYEFNFIAFEKTVIFLRSNCLRVLTYIMV